jgi:hypothetical protein
MATVGNLAFTLAEWAKRLDPDGKVAKIVELLAQTNEILDDALWVEGNLPTGHRTTVRTDLPSVTWRKLNYGVKPGKSKTKQVDDVCGMLEAYAEVDKDLADLNGNTSEFRLSEDRAFLEAMNQEMASTMVYGDTAINPERFLGLSARYPYLDSPNVIDCGGAGDDCTSIWLVVWGESTVHMTFPKGTKAGLSHEDKGQVTLEDGDGGRYEGYRTHYQWKPGMVVRDWRYVARLCNIDTGDWPSAEDMLKYLVQLIGRVPNIRMGKPSLYMSQAVKDMLDVAAMGKSNVFIQVSEDPFGLPVTKFRGIPLRRVDTILNTETALVAVP